MRKANILYVVDSLEIGGAEKIITDIAERLNPEKYNISFCCVAKGGKFLKKLKGKMFYILGKRKGIDLRLIPKIRDIIKKEKIDIVHTHLPSGHFYGRSAAILSGAKILVSTYHGMGDFSAPHFFARRLQSLFNDRIIAVSKAVMEYYCRKEKARRAKFSVVYNGIDADEYHSLNPAKARKALGLGKDDFVVGYVGRLEKVKNIQCLLKAAKAVGENVRHSKFLIVGYGELEDELRKKAEEIGLGNVIFTGARDDIPDVLSAMDVVVLPSFREGCSISLLEAMASAKPVIATKVGGNPELVDNCKTGILVQPDSPALLATAIMMLAGNSRAGKMMGVKAREKVRKKFTISSTVRKYEEVYDSLIRKKLK